MAGIITLFSLMHSCKQPAPKVKSEFVPTYWMAPNFDTAVLKNDANGVQIIYGHNLIANTSKYLGPKGIVSAKTNGMNCQNCHLNAGTKLFGNNYSAVAATYPKFRARSASIETMAKRVNDCIERSLDGLAIDTAGKEMQAIIAYFKWLGQNVKKGDKPNGTGITDLQYLDRAADTATGRIVYLQQCQSCHGANGAGVMNSDKVSFNFPPLWGKQSYNTGAGLYRISRLAGFVKDNMPYGPVTDHFHPQLSDVGAWDVAAFINSQPRPTKKFATDWPEIASKPIDHPFGPYVDSFSETQHKYGPFKPIKAARDVALKVTSK